MPSPASASPSSSAKPPSFSFANATPATIRRDAEEIQTKFVDAVDSIKKNKRSSSSRGSSSCCGLGNDDDDDATIDDAFAALSLAMGEASRSSARTTLPAMVHGDAAVRAASGAAKDLLKGMFDAALSDGGLYDRLVLASRDDDDCDHRGVIEDGAMGGGEDARFRRNVLRAMRRNGCGLMGSSKSSSDDCDGSAQKIRSRRRRIEDACTSFCAAINEHDGHVLLADDELVGLGDDIIAMYPIDVATGRRRVGLKAPDSQPVLKFATRSRTRRKVFEALSIKCQEENTPRFLEVLTLRDECATLLGYASHAAYVCEAKMVGTPRKAEEFLLELVGAYGPVRERELGLLLDMKRQDNDADASGGDDDGNGNGGDDDDEIVLDPWDVAHYTWLYKARSAGVDEAAIRRHFPLEHVKTTIFNIYEELLGLKFERVEDDAEVWNEDVECYAVRRRTASREEGVGVGGCKDDDDDVLGYFYLDIFPRKGKYSHQCVYPLRPSYREGGKGGRRVLPACVNIGNLTPSREGAPSMLLFREVETFFHEFGHVCHCVLANSEHSLHSWAWSAVPWPGGVEQDFLEVPSMMLENFVWCPEILRRLSMPPLPEPTIEALSKSRFLMTGYAKSKYLAMSLYDLKVHGGPGPYEFEGKEHDAVSLYNAMIERYTGIAPMLGSFAAASWFHLMMGYDAGYYGYIYSETYAADLFSKFSELSDKTQSVIDRDLGMKYRDTILSPCATADGEKMLVDFLGREPSKDAFLSRIPMS